MTTTIVQAEKLLNFYKVILGGLISLIVITGSVAAFGVNFMSDTKHNFATIFTGLKEVKDIATDTKTKVDNYHIDDVKFQQSTEDRLHNLETSKPEQIHYYPTRTVYRTQHVDAQGNRTMVR